MKLEETVLSRVRSLNERESEMASSRNLSPQYFSTSPAQFLNSHRQIFILHFNFNSKSINPFRLEVSRRTSNFPQKGDNFVVGSRDWKQNLEFYAGEGEEEDDDDEDEDDEEDRSLDLLIKFVENVFRKISRKARKAVRSVLPINISTKLVGFSVNGVIILAFLWILKAFLEVICTLGSVVFVSILLVRGIWTGISYLQETRNQRTDVFDDAWTGTQPVN